MQSQDQQSNEQEQEQKQLTVEASSLDRSVLEMYAALQDSVDNMDRKVQVVMKKHESEFLYAYRTHIKKIKKELEEIKKKSEEQEKMFSANDRIRYLEKQVTIFREEAIKLYDKLDQKNFEYAMLKQKNVQNQADAATHQLENKELLVKLKRMEATEIDYQRAIITLEEKVKKQDQKIRDYEKKLHTRELRKNFIESTKYTKVNVNPQKISKGASFKVHRNELQEWFLECVKTVKKEIHQRKNGFETLELSRINSISEFKLVDKLRLFELVLENQKLLDWFYHKIFPDGMDKITNYLSQVKTSREEKVEAKQQGHHSKIQEPQASKSARSSSMNRYREEAINLPRFQDPLGKSSSSARNKIQIRNGKMNISIA